MLSIRDYATMYRWACSPPAVIITVCAVVGVVISATSLVITVSAQADAANQGSAPSVFNEDDTKTGRSAWDQGQRRDARESAQRQEQNREEEQRPIV